MQNEINFELTPKVVEDLQTFSQLLNKDINTIFNEALQQYFENEQKKLFEKNIEDESAMTNLDFDEFWNGVDI
jgi:tRNA A37 N6-isopentenylltransferase MiaA